MTGLTACDVRMLALADSLNVPSSPYEKGEKTMRRRKDPNAAQSEIKRLNREVVRSCGILDSRDAMPAGVRAHSRD